MRIRVDPHTVQRAVERGAAESEIIDVLENGHSVPAKYGRMAKMKIFPYNQIRGGRIYRQKKVEVFCTIVEDTIVTVTCYVFYGQWENGDADIL